MIIFAVILVGSAAAISVIVSALLSYHAVISRTEKFPPAFGVILITEANYG